VVLRCPHHGLAAAAIAAVAKRQERVGVGGLVQLLLAELVGMVMLLRLLLRLLLLLAVGVRVVVVMVMVPALVRHGRGRWGGE